ncbi:MAG: hypothetical protein WC519_02000 [Parcubacteria group bacterium]
MRFTRNVESGWLRKIILFPSLWSFLCTIFVGAVLYGFFSSNVRDIQKQQDILLYVTEDRVMDESNFEAASLVKELVTRKINFDQFIAETADWQESDVTLVVRIIPSAEKVSRDPSLYDTLKPRNVKWNVFWARALTIVGAFFILCFNISYLLQSERRLNKDSNPANPDGQNMATYPWQKPSGWALAIILLPWLIPSQIIWGIVWFFRRKRKN